MIVTGTVAVCPASIVISGIVEVNALKLLAGAGCELSNITAGEPDSSFDAVNSFISAFAVI